MTRSSRRFSAASRSLSLPFDGRASRCWLVPLRRREWSKAASSIRAGRPVAGVVVELRNDITGLQGRLSSPAADGSFQFFNVPFNPYELHVEVKGFETAHQPVDVRSAAPLEMPITLKLAALSEAVTVTAETAAQLETDTSTSHVDIDKSYIARAPATVASRAMEELITATPGFAKDENGRYHFQGSHSQGQFVIDGQTISDQTGVTFSNSIDPGIAQSMEVIYGNVPAEYGEKVGAVVNLVTKSGLGTPFHGDLSGGAARFSTYEGGPALGGGSKNFGAFASLNGSWSDRFLDPVNFDNLHNHGDTERGFLRLDYAADELQDQVRFTALARPTQPRRAQHLHAGRRGPGPAGEEPRPELQPRLDPRPLDRRPPSTSTPSAALPLRAAALRQRHAGHGHSDRTLDNYGVTRRVTWAPNAHHEIKVGGVFKSFPIDETFGFGHHRSRLQRPGRRWLQPRPRAVRPDPRRPAPRLPGQAHRHLRRRLRPGQRQVQGPHREPRPALRPQQPADDRGPARAAGRPRLLHRAHRHRAARVVQPRSSTPPSTRTSSSARPPWPPRSCRPRSRTRASWATACCSFARSGRTPTPSGVQQAVGHEASRRRRLLVAALPQRGRPGPVPEHRHRVPDRLRLRPLQRLGRAPRPGGDARRPRLRLPRPHPRRLRPAPGGRPLPRRGGRGRDHRRAVPDRPRPEAPGPGPALLGPRQERSLARRRTSATTPAS